MPPGLQPNAETLTIVPGDLAANKLRRDFDREQQRLGRKVWQPAPVLSWPQWTRSLWSESVLAGGEDRLLLNAAQEHSLWRAIVSDGAAGDTLASADALATLAASAFRLAAAYGALPQLQAAAATHDARVFAGWAEAFTRLCRREGSVPQATLESALATSIARGSLTLPASLRFSGFLRWTPEQQRLLNTLRRAGTSVVEELAPAEKDSAPTVVASAGEAEELRVAAAWVRSVLRAGTEAGLTPRVAIVVPDVRAERDALESVLREVLAPELQLVGSEGGAPYSFSATGTLASHPMVAAALDLARWTLHPLERERISALLLSPYVGGTIGLAERARFDASTLRRAALLHPEADMETVLRLARDSKFGAGIAQWLNSLRSLTGNGTNSQQPRSYADWTESLRRLLRAAGWPGDTLAAADNAALRAWEHTLDTVATLDFTGNRVRFADALQALALQLAAAPLDESRGDVPVQILHPQDLPGMRFDALVFSRATDANWPAPERANPLLDWKLQSTLGMPGADRGHTADQARQLTGVLLGGAPRVLVTYAANTPDGKQRLSPLIANLALPEADPAAILAGLPPPEHVAPEIFSDDVPLPPLPGTLVHGGAAVLRHQAACGFRAFAEIRLRATAPDTPEAGLSASDRGNLLHLVLQSFWAEAGSQRALRDMPAEERRALLNRCIENALHTGYHASSEWDSAYLHVQKQRLFRLLEQWLEHELERGPFAVVASEKSTLVSVGPIDLEVRIDRVDQLENGIVLVDYKTGSSASPADWHGERPDEPQLPLYALLPEDGTLAGVAFAKVRPGRDMKWTGYAAADGILPGRNTVQPLDDLAREWRFHLETLAEAFAAGDTAVRPKEHPVTCKHCAQNLLCRLDAATLLLRGDDSAAEEDAEGAAR